jgi:small-conductance mechanosensitive channel
VDLQEKRQLDLAKQVAKVKARARPWRAIIAGLLAIVAAGVSYASGHRARGLFEPGQLGSSIVTVAAAGAFLLFASIAVVGLANSSRRALEPATGSAHAAIVRYAIVLVGAVAIIVITLALFKIPVGQLILGGAVTTLLVGIAAQQSLSNVFAGLVLLLSRPFSVGDLVWIRSGALGGQLEGTVTEIGITYLRLDTGSGVMHLPNSQVLAAAVSRRAPATEPDGAGHDGPDGQLLPPPGAELRDGGSTAS